MTRIHREMSKSSHWKGHTRSLGHEPHPVRSFQTWALTTGHRPSIEQITQPRSFLSKTLTTCQAEVLSIALFQSVYLIQYFCRFWRLIPQPSSKYEVQFGERQSRLHTHWNWGGSLPWHTDTPCAAVSALGTSRSWPGAYQRSPKSPRRISPRPYGKTFKTLPKK